MGCSARAKRIEGDIFDESQWRRRRKGKSKGSKLVANLTLAAVPFGKEVGGGVLLHGYQHRLQYGQAGV